ncbi:MAG TPA: outer membrane lipoprotein carrier protein LolA [Candidatus Sulfotelmatobacter sp.]|nr:outer membrane lipoprotein carrier protein LolA [Candidatus Sulfotelmatobacter sp.]
MPALRSLLATCVALLALAGPVASAAAAPPKPAPLTEQDRADLGRIEAYLNALHTATATFLQESDSGGIARGKFYLSRPGKMRFEYEPPTPILMVSTGNALVYYDSLLKQTSYLPLNSTPLGLLLREHVGFGSEVTITKFERGADTIRITLVETKDPDQGSLILVFTDKPLALKQWTVIDQQRKATRVTLIELQTDMKLDPKLFQFTQTGGPGVPPPSQN